MMSEFHSQPDEFADRPELIQQRARVILAERAWRWFLSILVTVAILILVFNALQSMATRQELIGCTTPGHSCYDEGQKRTAAVVQQLIDANQLDEIATRHVVTLTESCGKQPEIMKEKGFVARTELIDKCVTRQLVREQQREEQ